MVFLSSCRHFSVPGAFYLKEWTVSKAIPSGLHDQGKKKGKTKTFLSEDMIPVWIGNTKRKLQPSYNCACLPIPWWGKVKAVRVIKPFLDWKMFHYMNKWITCPHPGSLPPPSPSSPLNCTETLKCNSREFSQVLSLPVTATTFMYTSDFYKETTFQARELKIFLFLAKVRCSYFNLCSCSYFQAWSATKACYTWHLLLLKQKAM